MKKKKHHGVSLIELLLVLAIASSIIIFGIRQYQSYRLDADVQQLKYNVNILFAAMAQYEKVNCYGVINASQRLVPGKLNPIKGLPSIVGINTTGLRGERYLTISLPESPLIDNAVDDNGFILQFNQHTQPRMVCKTASATSGPAVNAMPPTCDEAVQMGTIVSWSSQVAARVKDTSFAPQLLILLGADCLSSKSGSTVTPCGNIYPGSGEYVVWERSPNFGGMDTPSKLGVMNPLVEQFRQQYTTYPGMYLLNNDGNISAGGSTQPQYLYCGT